MKAILRLILLEQLILSTLGKAVTRFYVFVLWLLIWPATTIFGKLGRRKALPAISSRLLLLPATDLATKIRTREVPCTEVVQAFIARVQEVNPLINAVVQERFRDALLEAREIDEILATGKLSEEYMETNLPLLGVPLTVKETIALRGMSNNGAFSKVREHVASKDATIVRHLREAGAIALLVSNTPELCMCWETFNPRVGCTNNPYDTRRTPAGSSGGEAALLGSAASVVSVGSDIGGSLRLPAMFCGVFGHKPTPGFVSNQGHRPSGQDKSWDLFFTLGPMVRYAVDLPLMLRTMIGDQKKVQELNLDEEVDLSKVKVFYMESDGPEGSLTDPVSTEVKSAMRRAVAHLQRKYGVSVRQASIEGLQNMIVYTVFIMMRMKGVPNVYQKTEEDPDEWNSVVVTIMKRLLCLSSASLSCMLYGPLKAIVDLVPEERFQTMLRKKEQYMNLFKDMLGDDGVLLYPTFHDVAHFHNQIFYKFMNVAYLSIFNVLEMPVTACPMGLNKDGLPVGIQISAWQKQDRLTMAVARALEEKFGGWVPPCPKPDC